MNFTIKFLDVWGNEEDGFEVNDVLSTDTIDSSELDNFTAFCNTYLRGPSDLYKIIWHDENSGEVNLKVNGRPILNFERINL